MPVQIGAQSHSFSDPTGLLSDCHRRIEMFLGALERVASVIDRPLTEDVRAPWNPRCATFERMRQSIPRMRKCRCFRVCVRSISPK